MIRLMPSQLRQGENEFAMIMTRGSSTGFDYGPIMAFDAADFGPGHERREFMIGTFAWMQLAVAALVALFAMLLWIRSRDRAEPFWLFIVAACWGLMLLFFKWVDPPIGGDLRVAYINSLFLLMACACFGWACAWSARPLG
jgi:fatty acid desaturase